MHFRLLLRTMRRAVPDVLVYGALSSIQQLSCSGSVLITCVLMVLGVLMGVDVLRPVLYVFVFVSRRVVRR